MFQPESDSKCRLCQEYDGQIDRTVSVRPVLATEQHIKRHDRLCAQLHFNMCKETGVRRGKEQWHEHAPKSAEKCREGKVAILWNKEVQIDRTSLITDQTS